jgi:hypothetical protein
LRLSGRNSKKQNICHLEILPTVWAARLLSALENALVYGQSGICNRDYEGDVRSSGDTVKIASIGNISIGTYTKDTDIGAPETLTDSAQTLLIDNRNSSISTSTASTVLSRT